jgi:hypothetical protein
MECITTLSHRFPTYTLPIDQTSYILTKLLLVISYLILEYKNGDFYVELKFNIVIKFEKYTNIFVILI